MPEFLAEGSAIKNLMQPDRVLVGTPSTKNGECAFRTIRRLHEGWLSSEKLINIHTCSSELSKLLANALLAQKISSINSISALCEETHASVLEVKTGVGSDKRIGMNHLHPSIGFGGHCFTKDVNSLIYICQAQGLPEVAEYWNGVLKINEF